MTQNIFTAILHIAQNCYEKHWHINLLKVSVLHYHLAPLGIQE